MRLHATLPPLAALRRPVPARALVALVALLAGCAGEPLLHDLPEREANEVLVALDEAGVAAEKGRDEGGAAGVAGGVAGGWTVRVAARDLARAHRLLAARALPRTRPAGLGEVFGKAGVVPTPVEEHARWLHALAGELAASIEAIDGVVEARVHLGLPAEDPLRPGARPAARAAVLVKCRPAACGPLRALEGGLRSLVAGAAEGLTPEAVAVVIAEGTDPAPPAQGAPPSEGKGRSGTSLALALLAGLGAGGLGLLAWRERRQRSGRP